MQLVSISQVQPGQTIAKAVTNEGGAVLCPPGFTLTESAIARLRNAGVESVIVDQAIAPGPSAEDRIALLNARFRDVDDPILLQIKATIENRLNFMKLDVNG